MKTFAWNNEKNIKLKQERGISFENDQVLDIIEHPDQERYKGQRLYVIEISNFMPTLSPLLTVRRNGF